MPDWPDDIPAEVDAPADDVDEPAAVRSLVAPALAPFSSTPVTRTRWFTYWLRFTLDPCGFNR